MNDRFDAAVRSASDRENSRLRKDTEKLRARILDDSQWDDVGPEEQRKRFRKSVEDGEAELAKAEESSRKRLLATVSDMVEKEVSRRLTSATDYRCGLSFQLPVIHDPMLPPVERP